MSLILKHTQTFLKFRLIFLMTCTFNVVFVLFSKMFEQYYINGTSKTFWHLTTVGIWYVLRGPYSCPPIRVSAMFFHPTQLTGKHYDCQILLISITSSPAELSTMLSFIIKSHSIIIAYSIILLLFIPSRGKCMTLMVIKNMLEVPGIFDDSKNLVSNLQFQNLCESSTFQILPSASLLLNWVRLFRLFQSC